MAAIGRKRRRSTTTTVTRRPRTRRVGATVGRTHRRRTRRRVGSTIGRTRRRVGSTGGGTLKQVGMMAIGVAGGAMLTHMALRPLEKHVTDHYPMAAKFMGAAEILIGGYIAIHAKNAIVKGVGMGVLGGGVHTMMHQFHIGTHSPAIHGPDDYITTNVPISGHLEHRMQNLLNTSRSNLVAGGGLNGTSNTGLISGKSYHSYLMGTECGDDTLNYYKH